MDTSRDAHREIRAKLTAAILFLCTAASIGFAFLKFPQGPVFGIASNWDRAVLIAAAASPLALLFACVLVFFRPRLAYGLGLCAGFTALAWFVRDEVGLGPWNSWIILNYESPIRSDEAKSLTFADLNILSVALIVITAACATLRLLPARWSWRRYPVQQRTWPAFAVGLLVMVAWFVHSATPYSAPGFDHGQRAELRILHVQKCGLRFHESTVADYGRGRVWVWRNNRRLFQYRFENRAAQISLWGASQSAYERARAFTESPELWRLHTPPPKPLRAWNAEGWYVVLKDSRVLTFTTEYGMSPPAKVTQLFHEIEKLPASDEQLFAVRDVCLGFCYDPVAALGFSVAQQRTRLLSASGYGGGF